MALGYTFQNTITLFGSKTAAGVRTGVELESTYQAEAVTDATKSFAAIGMAKMELHILYSMGAGETTNSIEIKVEASPDNINWYRFVNESASTGTSTLTAREFTYVGINATDGPISLPLDISAKYFRVSIKETGVGSTKGTCYAEATLSGSK